MCWGQYIDTCVTENSLRHLRLLLAADIQSIVMFVLQCVSICSSHIDKCVANRGRLYLEEHNNITLSVMWCLNSTRGS